MSGPTPGPTPGPRPGPTPGPPADSTPAPPPATPPRRPWRRVVGLLPGVVILLAGATTVTHDATWSDYVGFGIGVVGLLAVALPVTYGRGRGIAVFVAGVAVVMGGVGVVDGGWLGLLGRTTAATVVDARSDCVGGGRGGCRLVDVVTLRAPDGTRIPGRLQLPFASHVDVGDTVTVHWDPTGLVANPRTTQDTSLGVLLVGAVTVLGAIGVLVYLAWTSVPEPYVPPDQRPDHSPEGIRRRLAAEAEQARAETSDRAAFADRTGPGLASAATDPGRELRGEVTDRGDPAGAGIVEHPPHER